MRKLDAKRVETSFIETNLGDLIFAINEAAHESGASATELATLTQKVLEKLLARPKQFPRETLHQILAFLQE